MGEIGPSAISSLLHNPVMITHREDGNRYTGTVVQKYLSKKITVYGYMESFGCMLSVWLCLVYLCWGEGDRAV